MSVQVRHVSSLAACANALACLGLGTVLAALLLGWPRRPWRWLIAGWLVLGYLRAAALSYGAAPGWRLDQAIEARGQVVASNTQVEELRFEAGQAPAHLVNDLNLNFHGRGAPDRTQLPLSVTARAFVRRPAVLLVTSSAPARVTFDGKRLADLAASGHDSRVSLATSSEGLLEIAMAPAPANGSASPRWQPGCTWRRASPCGPGSTSAW